MKFTDCSCCIQNCEIKQHYNFNQTVKQTHSSQGSVFVTHYTWLWSLVSSASFHAAFRSMLSIPVSSIRQLTVYKLGGGGIGEQSHVHAHREHNLYIPNMPWPTSAKISSENLFNDPFIRWKCPTVLKHQNVTSYKLQTPQELHCCLMLAQISTTHIHKQIEPVLPYVMELKTTSESTSMNL